MNLPMIQQRLVWTPFPAEGKSQTTVIALSGQQVKNLIKTTSGAQAMGASSYLFNSKIKPLQAKAVVLLYQSERRMLIASCREALLRQDP